MKMFVSQSVSVVTQACLLVSWLDMLASESFCSLACLDLLVGLLIHADVNKKSLSVEKHEKRSLSGKV